MKLIKAAVMVVAGAALVAFSGGLATGLLAGIASAGAIAGVGASIALMGVSSLLVKVPKLNTAIGERLSLNTDPQAYRKIVVGHTAAASDVRFKESWGNNKDHISYAIANATHPISFKSITFDGVEVWNSDAGGFIQSSMRAGIQTLIPVSVGTPNNGQALGTGNRWTYQSTFVGCAYTLITFLADSKKWPNGLPSQIVTTVEGTAVYDPRLDSDKGGSGPLRYNDQTTWRYRSDNTANGVAIGRNPALFLLSYLKGWRINDIPVWGMNISEDRINFQSFIEYANLCEEHVEAADGGTVQRYTIDTIFSTGDTHENIINAVCAAMGTAVLVDTDGVYQLVGGFDDTLTTPLAFDGNDILSGGEWIKSPPVRDRHNVITGKFADPDQGYKLNTWGQIKVDPLFDGIPRTLTVDFQCVNRADTAQRIAKQMLLREKYSGTYTARFGPRAFGLSVGSLLTLTLPAHGFVNKLFRVESQSESFDLAFDMKLREESPEIYQWDKDETKPLPTQILTDVFDPLIPVAVQNFAISARSVNGQNSVSTIFVDCSWLPAPSARVASIEIQSRSAGSTVWQSVSDRAPDTGSLTFTSSVNGGSIEVQARYRMNNGVNGNWVSASLANTPVSTVNIWDNIANPSGTKPANNATNTRDLTSPFGTGTVGSIIQQVGDAATNALAASTLATTANTNLATVTAKTSLLATVSTASINVNTQWDEWPGGDNTAPTGWSWWDASAGVTRAAGVNGHPYCVRFNVGANQNAGFFQQVQAAFGAFVIEFTGRATDWQGAGVYVEFCNGDHSTIVEAVQVHAATTADTSGYLNRDGGGGNYTRSWSVFHQTPINDVITAARIYAMAAWDTYGERPAKTVWFDRVSIRQATDAEIAGKRADAVSTATKASFDTFVQTYATDKQSSAQRVTTLESLNRSGFTVNLLRNSDFSSQLRNWNHAGNWQWGGFDPNVGSYAAHNQSGNGSPLWQDVAIYGGGQYTLSYSGNAFNGGGQYVRVQWWLNDTFLGDGVGLDIGGNNGWNGRRVSDLQYAPANANKARILAYCDGGSNFHLSQLQFQSGPVTNYRRDGDIYDSYARLTTTESVASDAYGRSRAFIQMGANAGNGRAQLTLYADSNGGGGVDLVGDLQVSGNALFNGSITASKFLTNQGVDLAAIVPGSLNYRLSGATGGQWGLTAGQGPFGPLATTGWGTFNGHEIEVTVSGAIGGGQAAGPSNNYEPQYFNVYVDLYYYNGAWQYAGNIGIAQVAGSYTPWGFTTRITAGNWGNCPLGLYYNCFGSNGTMYDANLNARITMWK